MNKNSRPRVLAFVFWIFYLLFFLPSCQQSQSTSAIADNRTSPSIKAPDWTKDAIWYQIFVERFRSGAEDNNPSREDLIGAWPDSIPDTWAITPWGQQWYEADPWFKDCADDDFYHGIQARRYGGDLIGVLNKLDYLKDLGINAIYFNPLNHAPSLHKYDPTYYHHIDHHFGPDPQHDKKLIETETMGDASTWVWTKADKLFLEIIKACHDRDIRVILDYSWNHTGRTFWAFKDIQKNKKSSEFVDWYYIHSFGDEDDSENGFDYKSWFGATTLPELRETIIGEHPTDRIVKLEGNIFSASLKQHIFDVSRRWLDPNNDGNIADGVDGFRLDVAAEIPMGFWREYRSFVKNINPDAYLVGEVWYEKWPDDLLDPKPFLGEAFDAVMNYRWYREARRLFAKAGEKITPSQFVERIGNLYANMDKSHQYAMMNVVSSHDAPRVLTSLYNKGKYKFNTNAKNPDYKINRPDEKTYKELELLLVHQYTFFGAPHIWNGDEMGMWGGDDPDCRKPLIWPDIDFADETIHPTKDQLSTSDKVTFNHALHTFYKKIIALRNREAVLRNGELEFILADDKKQLLGYRRYNDNDEIIVLFNLSAIATNANFKTKNSDGYADIFSNKHYSPKDNTLDLTVDPMSFIVLKRSI